ncbi:MAG TPA: HD-GYP domain-containing protein, partial [Syntrophomonadaceae bacterium]|nr:HD-GYP domain-containing protein [Syntrophomonadaceae bacterium]
MIRIATDKLKSGMIIARTVIGFEGKTLFARNTKLTDLYISRLIKLGVGSIYIKDGLDDFDIPEIVSEEVKLLVSSTLSKSFKKFSLNKSL